MKISVFIEFGALTCGFGMLVGGFFGMNTKSGLEDERFAWIATVTTSLFLMSVIFGLFTWVDSFNLIYQSKTYYLF